MTTLIRPLGMTGYRQTLTLPTAGYSQTVQAYLWGAGGGAGGRDGARQGGAGTGGGYVAAQFTVNPGDTVELTVGSGGGSGYTSNVANDYETPIFNTRTAIPIGKTTALPDASKTYVARWSKFLNDNGVWATGTAPNGSTTSLANTLTFDQSYTVFFQIPFLYVFRLAAYYNAKVYIDGELLFESGLDSWKTQESGGVSFITNITPGNHTVRITANADPGASYGVFGVALTIALNGNAGVGGAGLVREVFSTRNTPATPPLSVQSAVQSSTNIYSNLMFDYGMWEANVRAPSCTRTYPNIYFPYTGVYQIQMSATGLSDATVSIDGAVVFTVPTDSYSTAYTTDVTVNQGYHTVSFAATFFTLSPLPSGGVAIVISKSWSGATGGVAGPKGSSGGGGGSGGATTLVLNPRTVNETLIAVAVGGAGGGGAGNSTVGQAEATAPGPRGRTAAGVSSPQMGQSQGDFHKDGGGGGAGGPGGPAGAGKNGYSGEISYTAGGDAYGQAGTVGIGYLNPIATGQVIDPVNTSVAFRGPYYDLLPNIGIGGVSGSNQGGNGGAVFIFTSFGPRVRTDAGWQEVTTIFVNVNGVWKQVNGMYIKENNDWEPVVGTFVPTFEPQSNDYGTLSRIPDLRPLPTPPPPPKPIQFNSSPSFGGCCFVAGTMIALADGSHKRIEHVVIGDQVIGLDGAINTVQDYIRPLLGDRTLVGFNGGAPFITNDHPVLATDGTWRSVDPAGTASKYAEANLDAGQLSVGDTIATGDGAGFEIVSIQEHVHSADLQVYNFSLDGNRTYIANNLVVHNKGPGAGCGPGGGAGCTSDVRLKYNIELIDTRDDGLKIYTFKYVWSDVKWVGVMAQDLLQQPQFAHAVCMEANGFYSVDYSKINFEMVRADMYCVES